MTPSHDRAHRAIGALVGLAVGDALGALGPDVEAAVVVLADGPGLAPQAVDRVVAAWRENGTPLVAASYGGDRGHPLVVARELWDTVPDEGLRAFDPLLVPCDDLGAPGDVDRATTLLRAAGETVHRIGAIEPRPAGGAATVVR